MRISDWSSDVCSSDLEAFQEIDYRRMFGQLAKWVAEIDDARRIPEMVSRAFHTATSGRPGPVVLALPEDMLSEAVPAPVRPEERREGKECASTGRSRRWPYY